MSCSNCNANCEHCYISYTGNMTDEYLLKMCKLFKNRYKIIINGTERLLHDDYFEALKLSNQSRILTNGLVIHKDASIFKKTKETGKKYSKDILKIKRNGLLGKDNDNPNCNFKCIASIDEVVITPDGNVYSCIFMTKPGYEIGHYENGKNLLDYQLDNNGNSCIAHDIFNKNEYSFYKKHVRK